MKYASRFALAACLGFTVPLLHADDAATTTPPAGTNTTAGDDSTVTTSTSTTTTKHHKHHHHGVKKSSGTYPDSAGSDANAQNGGTALPSSGHY